MRSGSLAGLVGELAQGRGMAEEVDRVKVLNLFPTLQVPGDEVGGLNGIHRPRLQAGVEGHIAAGPDRVRETRVVQDALNRRRTGDGQHTRFRM